MYYFECLHCDSGSGMSSLIAAEVLFVVLAIVASSVDAQVTCYSFTSRFNELDCDPPTATTPKCHGATCVTYTLPYGKLCVVKMSDLV